MQAARPAFRGRSQCRAQHARASPAAGRRSAQPERRGLDHELTRCSQALLSEDCTIVSSAARPVADALRSRRDCRSVPGEPRAVSYRSWFAGQKSISTRPGTCRRRANGSPTGNLLHPEHPPLAKLLIAASVKLVRRQRRSAGGRSALLFGALTLTAVGSGRWRSPTASKAALFAAAIDPLRSDPVTCRRASRCSTCSCSPSRLGLAASPTRENVRGAARRSIRGARLGGSAFGLAGACKLSGFFRAARAHRAEARSSLSLRVRRRQRGDDLPCAPGAPRCAESRRSAIAAFFVAPVLAYLACFMRRRDPRGLASLSVHRAATR